jgi:hypothetical protein
MLEVERTLVVFFLLALEHAPAHQPVIAMAATSSSLPLI